ncbi:MAG: LamB/YcsF family protein [Candidatus Caenarcaniphilales bacterium]|jgi:UPF0271 protein|nr:LamB/YcsF family protein [Candidatus Caenarcaniphilales bacterium]
MQTDPFISRQIDLNLDIGQGIGQQVLEKDLLPYATSVNVSTGAHSGDPSYIDQSIKACKQYETIMLGGLISYPDVLGFGLRKIQLSNDELRASILMQLGGLAALAKSYNYEINHVRAHGYLYHQMVSNYSIAETVVKAIQEFSKWIILLSPHSSVIQEVGSWTSIRVAYEARFDLRYRNDGSLISFDLEKDGDLDIDLATQRARDLVYKSSVKTEEGPEHELKFESIHLPSRLKNSLDIAKLVRSMILKPLPLKTIDYEPYLAEFL